MNHCDLTGIRLSYAMFQTDMTAEYTDFTIRTSVKTMNDDLQTIYHILGKTSTDFMAPVPQITSEYYDLLRLAHNLLQKSVPEFESRLNQIRSIYPDIIMLSYSPYHSMNPVRGNRLSLMLYLVRADTPDTYCLRLRLDTLKDKPMTKLFMTPERLNWYDTVYYDNNLPHLLHPEDSHRLIPGCIYTADNLIDQLYLGYYMPVEFAPEIGEYGTPVHAFLPITPDRLKSISIMPDTASFLKNYVAKHQFRDFCFTDNPEPFLKCSPEDALCTSSVNDLQTALKQACRSRRICPWQAVEPSRNLKFLADNHLNICYFIPDTVEAQSSALRSMPRQFVIALREAFPECFDKNPIYNKMGIMVLPELREWIPMIQKIEPFIENMGFHIQRHE